MPMCRDTNSLERSRRDVCRLGMYVFLLAFGFGAGAGAAAVENGAVDLVRTTSVEVQKILQQRHAELEMKPGLINGVVEQYIFPHFDFERMSQLVLGKYWRAANPDERRQFVEEFRLLLVRTYATAMLKYSDQEINFLPYRGKPEDSEVVVQTEVELQGGQPVPIDYSLYRKVNAWKVFDVKIENVSLVVNYRGTFAGEIRNGGGVGALIQKLHERNQQAMNE